MSMPFGKTVVFVVTFTSYALYHSARKTLSGVKSSVTEDWLDNVTHNPLFDTGAQAKTFLGTLDAVFMTAYATGLFFWGWLGDRSNPKYVVVTGMMGSAVLMVLFGVIPKWYNFYNVTYYVLTYTLFGFVQACGWPNEIAIMANWFGKANRGFVMGLWASSQPVGNVFGSYLTAIILPLGYQTTFLAGASLMLVGAVVVMLSISVRPKEEGYFAVTESNRRERRSTSEEETGEPISILKAILLPGVLAYCLCNASLKLVNYAFFFWLPLYLTEAFQWEEAKADELSIWYDIGGIIGSVAGGYISDKMGCRTPLIVVMLGASVGALFVYSHAGPTLVWNAFLMTIVGVTISGPYNLIVGTISVDLGSQPALAGNAKAMATVSGLIDGTGSVGSAFGQIFVPVLQNSFGWGSVFYLFMTLNLFAIVCIMRRCLIDLRSLLSTSSELTPLLNEEQINE
ncbi:transporter, major facilitator family protein [Necator americanus]|uniref:Transporter, major facilitator family protein n=1 Tax=Necator americanus TaxID=51031 RepID=W2SRQ9_NECAM|nr:transporter, major facilitator family protein [Necator americanus]ETN72429.1 transporter, major facilitator family protein [Necator americanus]